MHSIRLKIRILALIATLAILCAHAQRAAEISPSRGHAPARRLDIDGIPNAAEVTPYLYRGGVPSKHALDKLSEMGIKIVIDLRGSRESEKKEVTELGMQYIPLPWHCPFPRDAVFARFLTILRDHPHKKILVHCRLGDDRAGMMIAAYRMAEQGWTAEQAMKEMELYGFSFSHRFICPSLASYEAHFPKRFKTSSAFSALRNRPQAPTSVH